MSRFFSTKYRELTPYVTDEELAARPHNAEDHAGTSRLPAVLPSSVVDLSTLTPVFPPSSETSLCLSEDGEPANETALTRRIAELNDVSPEEVLVTGGACEALNLAMMAFSDRYHPAAFPDTGSGFYRVIADLNGIPFKEIPLREGFALRPDDYLALGRTIFIANPNAVTGMALGGDDIEGIVRLNPDNAVIIDETCIGYGAPSCVPLIRGYWNLLVIRDLSVTHGLRAVRIGYAIGNAGLISDLRLVARSANPYGISELAAAAALSTLDEDDYARELRRIIAERRTFLTGDMMRLGFETTASYANFIFAKHSSLSGAEVHSELRKRNIIVRHFDSPEPAAQYNRITLGTRVQLQALLDALKEICAKEP